MLQVLALIAMELPAKPGGGDLRDREIEALRSIRPPLDRVGVASRTRRARYGPGRLAAPPEGSGETVPAYADEDGVDPGRNTETFAEIVLELDMERWAGTPFVLRAGKALSRRRKMAVLCLRRAIGPPATGATGTPGSPAGRLTIGIDGPEDITLQLAGGAPGAFVPVTLSAPPPRDDLPPYAHVLLDFLSGGSTISVRGDAAEQAWRVVTPVLEAWADGVVPLEEYAAGSEGPAPLLPDGC